MRTPIPYLIASCDLMPLDAAVCGRPKGQDQLWLPDSVYTASSSPGNAVILSVILQELQEINWYLLSLHHPLFPVLSVPTAHSHWGYGAIRKHYHKTAKSNSGNEVSIKEFGVLALEAKCWFTEHPVHCQVVTKPGLMSSAHWLQPREMLSLLDSILSSLLRPILPHAPAEAAKLEMKNPSFLFSFFFFFG